MAGAKVSAGQTVILILATLLHLVVGFYFLFTILMAPPWGLGFYCSSGSVLRIGAIATATGPLFS